MGSASLMMQRGAPKSGKEDFRKFAIYSGIIGGERFCSTPLDKIVDATRGNILVHSGEDGIRGSLTFFIRVFQSGQHDSAGEVLGSFSINNFEVNSWKEENPCSNLALASFFARDYFMGEWSVMHYAFVHD
ncbi:hypothetical protein Tco_0970113 [Tanacetum coccineum]